MEYNSDSESPATDLIEIKILLNSIISDTKQGARFASIDLKDMFLHTIMETIEYMKVQYKYFPDDIKAHYHLVNLAHSNDYVYIRIQKEYIV